MRSKAHIFPFPKAGEKDEGPRRKAGPPRTTDTIKYFSRNQIKLLRRTAREQAELDIQKGKITGIREWMAIDLLTTTGLRVSEAANLKCGDLKIGYSESKIFIHNGKGSRSTIVSKGISAGKSNNTYRGQVSAHRKATGARNFTNCDSLLIGHDCGAHTVPYIESKNASAVFEHEATTSKISEDQLFYAQQRGLSQEEPVQLFPYSLVNTCNESYSIMLILASIPFGMLSYTVKMTLSGESRKHLSQSKNGCVSAISTETSDTNLV